MTTLLSAEQLEQSRRAPSEIEVPASTAWPLVLAFGFTLVFAGLLTSASVSVLGAVLAIVGCVGWFREVFPHEHEEVVPVVPEDVSVATERRVVERLPVAPEQVRAWLPLETYPISAGVKGGLAGSVAMAVLACLYGLLKTGSIWYPINLLAAVVYAPSEVPSASQLNSFHAGIFLIAVVLPSRHVDTCGIAVWCDASHVRASSHCARRPDCSGSVVGAAVLHYGHSQSRAWEPH